MAEQRRRGIVRNLANAADAVINVAANHAAPAVAAAGIGMAAGVTGDKALRRLLQKVEQLEKHKKPIAAVNVNAQNVARGITAVTAPVTTAGVVANKKPVVITGRNSKTVRHQELLTTVISNGTSGQYFVHYDKPLQPGDGSMGEWLKTEAAGWESYRVNSCTAIYVPSAGTSDRGNLALIPDYDALDAPPQDMRSALAFAQCVNGPIHAYMDCALDTVAMMQPEKRKFVRDGPLHYLNSRTNDCGKLTLVSEGVTLAPLTLMGHVLLRYDITFYTPHVRSPSDAIDSSPISVLHVGTDTSFSTANQAQTIPVPYVFKTVNNLHVTNDPSATGVLHLARGVYRGKASLSASFGAGSIFEPRIYLDGPVAQAFYGAADLVPSSRCEMPNAVVTGNEWQMTFDFYVRVDSDASDMNFLRIMFQPNASSSTGVMRATKTDNPINPWYISTLELTLISLIY